MCIVYFLNLLDRNLFLGVGILWSSVDFNASIKDLFKRQSDWDREREEERERKKERDVYSWLIAPSDYDGQDFARLKQSSVLVSNVGGKSPSTWAISDTFLNILQGSGFKNIAVGSQIGSLMWCQSLRLLLIPLFLINSQFFKADLYFRPPFRVSTNH